MIRRLSLFIATFLSLSLAQADMLDPTRPLSYNEYVEMHCSRNSLLLQSINYGESRKIALISGRFYSIGDKINLYTIESITPTSVTLKQNDKTTVLTL